MSKISLKYDQWQREVLLRFSEILQDSMTNLFRDVSAARSKLEKQNIHAGSMQETISFILYVQEVNGLEISWNQSVDLYGSCEKLLRRQRFTFPKNWLFIEGLLGEWVCFFFHLDAHARKGRVPIYFITT